jgi:hypothetical protein
MLEVAMKRVGLVLVMVGSCATAAAAQRLDVSIGIDGMAIRFHALGENPVGGGLRATIDLGPILGFDGEYAGLPANPSGNFGERLRLAGVRLRLPLESRQLFVRVRAGSVYFGGSFFDGRLSSRTRPAIDLGLTFEKRLASHAVVRLDVGDLIVSFAGATYLGIHPTPDTLETTHNPMVAAGFAVRFGGG